MLNSRSAGYRGVMGAAVAAAADIGLQTVHDIDADFLSRFAAHVKQTRTDTTAASYVKHLLALRRWAWRVGICPADVTLPHGSTASTRARRTPPTDEQVRAWIKAAKTARPNDAKRWRWIIRGLWASGLRLGESYRLTWHPSGFCVRLSPVAVYVIGASSQKARRDQTIPIAPEFVAMLRPRARRNGCVFPYPCSQSHAGRILRQIAQAAGLDHSAHDLRRAFGTRWAPRLMPADLRALMRHGSIETTLRYYVDIDAADLGARLGAALGDASDFPTL